MTKPIDKSHPFYWFSCVRERGLNFPCGHCSDCINYKQKKWRKKIRHCLFGYHVTLSLRPARKMWSGRKRELVLDLLSRFKILREEVWKELGIRFEYMAVPDIKKLMFEEKWNRHIHVLIRGRVSEVELKKIRKIWWRLTHGVMKYEFIEGHKHKANLIKYLAKKRYKVRMNGKRDFAFSKGFYRMSRADGGVLHEEALERLRRAFRRLLIVGVPRRLTEPQIAAAARLGSKGKRLRDHIGELIKQKFITRETDMRDKRYRVYTLQDEDSIYLMGE